MGSGVAAVSLNFTAIESHYNTSGYLRAWAADQSEPTSTSSLNYVYDLFQTNQVVVPVAADGTIKVLGRGSPSGARRPI